MIKKILTSLLLITTTLFLFGQKTAALKRTPYKLKIAVDKTTVYEENLKAVPFVLPNKSIQLYPGETLFIEIDQVNGVIKSMKAVKEIKDESKTVIINLSQTVKKKIHELMILKVTNPFAYKLSFKARIFLLDKKKWVNTDVNPLEPGESGFETWPDLITSVALGSWAFRK